MKEEWLFPNAVVPVDTQTTLALLVEIKRLIDVQNMASKSTYKEALAQQDGQSNFCAQCEAFARELKAVKQAALAQPAQEPKDIAELVEGMEVSIDVSTGDHDSGNRLFGSVTLVQENQGSKHGLILLVQDPEANYKIATPQQRPWVGLTEAQFLEATRLAENGNYLVAFVRIQEWLKEQNT
jgi:hypothetical protein